MNTARAQFQNQDFLNLETFRKNGTGVKTPVWFVEEDGRFYVRTVADSWKVKRVRNNPKVRVVPCEVYGKPIGSWVPALAREIDDPAMEAKIDQMLTEKYGEQRRNFDAIDPSIRMTVLEIELSPGT